MHPAAAALAFAALAAFVVGALAVITDLLHRPIEPVYFLIGGAALCGALFETVRQMTRPGRGQVSRLDLHRRSRRAGWLSDRSGDRAARTDQAAFLAGPLPRPGRVDDYGSASSAYGDRGHRADDPRAQAWDRRNPPPPRARLHAVSHHVDPGEPGRVGQSRAAPGSHRARAGRGRR